MPAITTLHELMVHQLKDIYSAEKQLVHALPKMAKGATSEELRAAFSDHLEQTEVHVTRLERVFEMLEESAGGVKCKGMEGLIEEGNEVLEEDMEPEARDAGLIAAAQRVEHYEIAAYGTVCEYARTMNHTDVLELLESTLEEEKEADETLTGLAETGINAMANAMDTDSQTSGMMAEGLADEDVDDDTFGAESNGPADMAPKGKKGASSKKDSSTSRGSSQKDQGSEAR